MYYFLEFVFKFVGDDAVTRLFELLVFKVCRLVNNPCPHLKKEKPRKQEEEKKQRTKFMSSLPENVTSATAANTRYKHLQNGLLLRSMLERNLG